ncbi:gliding motility-associated C-terminal domain-containing protein [Bernardetia sp.]|uniref:T9SS type B sorting domain-containing protein n=1 Tax=Bernardetia sp. TaxID=1937974 RepID=UPI0025C0ADC4|nr:gliding motility-associated C-terminal domain-containing protein [Bernardetia sp.]
MHLKNRKYSASYFFFVIITTLFFLYEQTLFAQTPCFDVSNVKGCAPLTVSVTDCSGADPDLVFYRFGSTAVQRETVFTFQQAGTYSISQLINTGGEGGDSVRRENIIQVFEPKIVDFEVIRCADKRIRVQINEDYYDSYKIDFGDNQSSIIGDNEFAEHTYSTEREFTITVRGLFEGGAENCTPNSKTITPVGALVPPQVSRFEVFENGTAKVDYTLQTDLPHTLEIQTPTGFEEVSSLETSSTSFTIQNVVQNGVYRISVQDICTNQAASSELFYVSDVSLIGEEDYIDVRWNKATGVDASEFVNYSLFKDGNIIFDTEEIAINQTSDEDVVCKVTYCYQLETEFSSGLKIISPKRCILAASNAIPPAVFDVYASFTPTGQVDLRWSYPVGKEGVVITGTEITRRNNKGNEIIYTINSSDSTFQDRAIDMNEVPYCYSISYKNACDLTSEPSSFICPIILKMEGSTDEQEGVLYFDWTAFQGEETNNYVLEQTDSIGKAPFNTQSVSSFGSYSLDIESQQNQTSYVRVRANLGDSITYSNTIRIDFQSFVNFPNAFTPNGDNLNDSFGVQAKFIKEFDMLIFNRWGEAVFRTNDINTRWDGRYRNGFAPAGEYTLKIVATDQRGREYVFTEMIKLIR